MDGLGIESRIEGRDGLAAQAFARRADELLDRRCRAKAAGRGPEDHEVGAIEVGWLRLLHGNDTHAVRALERRADRARDLGRVSEDAVIDNDRARHRSLLTVRWDHAKRLAVPH